MELFIKTRKPVPWLRILAADAAAMLKSRIPF
jgi:hypothetical protein